MAQNDSCQYSLRREGVSHAAARLLACRHLALPRFVSFSSSRPRHQTKLRGRCTVAAFANSCGLRFCHAAVFRDATRVLRGNYECRKMSSHTFQVHHAGDRHDAGLKRPPHWHHRLVVSMVPADHFDRLVVLTPFCSFRSLRLSTSSLGAYPGRFSLRRIHPPALAE